MPYNILSEYLCKIFYSKVNNLEKEICRVSSDTTSKNIFYNNYDKLVCKIDQKIKHRNLWCF